MKKLLSMMLLTVGIIFASQFTTIEKVSAELIYIYTNPATKLFDVYFDTDREVEEGDYWGGCYIVHLKSVAKDLKATAGYTGGTLPVYFYHQTIHYGGKVFDFSSGGGAVAGLPEFGLKSQSSIATKIYNLAMKQIRTKEQRKLQAEAAEKEKARLAAEKARREEAERQRLAAEKERNFNNLIAEGDKFYIAKNYDSAKNSYQKARNIDSEKIEYYCNELIKKGDSLSNEKNFVAAVDYFRKANVMGSSKSWKEFNGHYYKIFNINSNWQQAKEYCESMDGHLVTITSQNEQNFIENLINLQGTRNNLWIGSFRNSSDVWSWVTGESFSYSNWAKGMPDNYKNMQDKGMIMNKFHTGFFGKWDDVEANGGNPPRYGEENFSFICEWDNGIAVPNVQLVME